jgi:ornithine cyclodeaminase/alanine dehydrogenase-like protein (mu-crystallin family)
MYYAGLLKDEDIYGNLDQIISGELVGRENEEEIIYFNSVGLAFIDVMYAYEIYEQCQASNRGKSYRIQGNGEAQK